MYRDINEVSYIENVSDIVKRGLYTETPSPRYEFETTPVNDNFRKAIGGNNIDIQINNVTNNIIHQHTISIVDSLVYIHHLHDVVLVSSCLVYNLDDVV